MNQDLQWARAQELGFRVKGLGFRDRVQGEISGLWTIPAKTVVLLLDCGYNWVYRSVPEIIETVLAFVTSYLLPFLQAFVGFLCSCEIHLCFLV